MRPDCPLTLSSGALFAVEQADSSGGWLRQRAAAGATPASFSALPACTSYRPRFEGTIVSLYPSRSQAARQQGTEERQDRGSPAGGRRRRERGGDGGGEGSGGAAPGEVEALSQDQRLHQRYLRFRRLGEFAEMERV
jgi:hypothetical protein